MLKVESKTLVFLIILSFCAIVAFAGEDYYKLLGVPRDATTKQIRKAFRDLSLNLHPDKNKGDEEAAIKYGELNNAYEVLTNEEKRRIYDQYGEEGLKSGGAPQRQDNFFNSFFNFGQQRGGDQMRQGADVNLPLQVSLEDLYNGKLFTVAHRRQVLCPKCRGTGAKRPEDVKTCSECEGKGIKIETKRVGPGFIQQTQVTCPVCNGKGVSVTSKCSYCHSEKVHIGEEELFVEIERGMPNNHQIRFKHKADEAPDVNPGDLVFHLSTRPHPRFTRDGNNLYIKEEISLLEALTGFSHVVKHLDGHEFSIRRSDITIPGFVEKIQGEGMPVHEVPSQKGDLFVEYVVMFPKKLTATQKEEFKRLLA